jgi:hypothetical protein
MKEKLGLQTSGLYNCDKIDKGSGKKISQCEGNLISIFKHVIIHPVTAFQTCYHSFCDKDIVPA